MSDLQTPNLEPAVAPASKEPPPLPRWWAIRSRTSGHLATVGPLGAGAVLAYHDQNDAEADAAAMQQTQPNMLWEAMELPHHPPLVCLPDGYMRRARDVAFTMKITKRATGEVLTVRISAGPDVRETSLRELSAMFEIATSHMTDTHWVKSATAIKLGEILMPGKKEVA